MGALGKYRVIALHQKGDQMKIPSDLHGVREATFARSQNGRWAQAIEPICSELDEHFQQLGPLPRPQKRRVNVVLSRGDTQALDFAADAALYLGEKRHLADQELKKRIGSEPFPTKYLYMTRAGSEHWIELCRKRSYPFYRNSLRIIKDVSAEIAAELARHAGTNELDVISVGSGEGRKDLELLKRLTKQAAAKESIYYYPIDISDSLIIEAIRNATGGGVSHDRLRLKAILGDFAELRRLSMIYEERPEPNLFAVLGNTLGNADEEELLRAVDDSMQDGDFVLLEVNVGSVERTLRAAKATIYKEHDFTPLTALGFKFDPKLMRYAHEPGWSVIDGTDSVLARYAEVQVDKSHLAKDVCLSVVHHYEPKMLRKEIETRLSVKEIWWHQEGDNGFLLARRS